MTGWVVKPVEIDDVPIVTLAAASPSSDGAPCGVAEEVTQRLAGVRCVAGIRRGRSSPGSAGAARSGPDGGVPRLPLGCRGRSRRPTYASRPATFGLSIGWSASRPACRSTTRGSCDLVVGVFNERPVFLKDVADVVDGPDEVAGYVRHGWGPARGFTEHIFPGTVLGQSDGGEVSRNGVRAIAEPVGRDDPRLPEEGFERRGGRGRPVLRGPKQPQTDRARRHGADRHQELRADRRREVNELVEGLAVAILIVVAALDLRARMAKALIVAVAVPVVFGLTLAVN